MLQMKMLKISFSFEQNRTQHLNSAASKLTVAITTLNGAYYRAYSNAYCKRQA